MNIDPETKTEPTTEPSHELVLEHVRRGVGEHMERAPERDADSGVVRDGTLSR